MTQTEDSFPYEADFETQIWDEERFDRLLRQAAFLQRSLSTSPASRRESPSSGKDVPVRAKIESRAYEIYQLRGATHGRALDDWLHAEQEVLANHGENDPRMRFAPPIGLSNSL
jgi:hypothetical protein